MEKEYIRQQVEESIFGCEIAIVDLMDEERTEFEGKSDSYSTIWNGLLSICFPFPEYTISLEVNPFDKTNSCTLDFLIRDADRNIVLIFIGRRQEGIDWFQAHAQVLRYAQGTCSWAISMCGSELYVWWVDGGENGRAEWIAPVRLHQRGHLEIGATGRHKDGYELQYMLTDTRQWGDFSRLLSLLRVENVREYSPINTHN